MKREDVIKRLADGVVFHTQVMVNPANTSEWIVFFNKDAGRSFFLVELPSRCRPLPVWMR